jgi:hypothetical protein
MIFDVGGEKMRIDASGNVGIGTNSPSTIFNVQQNNAANIGLRMRQLSTTQFAGAGLLCSGPVGSGNQGGTAFYHFNLNTGGTEGAAAIAQFNADGGFQRTLAQYSYPTQSWSFFSNGTERMRIDSSGNVLVGTTATTVGNSSNEFRNTTADVWPLTLNANNRGLFIRNSASSSGFYAYFEYQGGTNNGSITWSGATTFYNTSSDYRLKDIDGPITNSGAYIDALRPVRGSWKADGSRFIGLLAHEVQEVSETPIATGEKDGEQMQAMDYSAPEIIANLIAEIQSLRARVAQIEGN